MLVSSSIAKDNSLTALAQLRAGNEKCSHFKGTVIVSFLLEFRLPLLDPFHPSQQLAPTVSGDTEQQGTGRDLWEETFPLL